MWPSVSLSGRGNTMARQLSADAIISAITYKITTSLTGMLRIHDEAEGAPERRGKAGGLSGAPMVQQGCTAKSYSAS